MSDNSVKNRPISRLRLVAECGILAALVFIGTELRIPTAIGYINLGDGVILIASYFVGPAAFFPAAIGSALGDLIAGYPAYIAPTFFIKGLMGLLAALIMRIPSDKKLAGILIRTGAGITAELIMVGGYFAFESVIYGMEAAAGSAVFNLIQGFVAVLLAIPLTYMIRIRKNN